MNRYSNVEVSAYHPMTTQEIWAPAAAMRQQHNEADKQLQTQIAELDKVDPLSVHYEKAQKIKSDLLNTISNQAETLATQGFNGNTTAGVYKTNRDLQSQFSPTGELGQINLAKKTYDVEKANYLEDATKNSKIGRDQALKNWENYAKTKYTGYSDDGKKISNITALGAPSYQDHDAQLAQMHSLLGSTSSSARSKGSKIVQIGGMYALKTASGAITTDSNIDQLNNMKKAYFDRWHNPNGEGYQWAEAAGIDHENLRNQDEFTFNSMIKNKRSDDTGESYNFLPGQKMGSDKEQPSGAPQPVSLPNAVTSKANEELLNKINGTYGKSGWMKGFSTSSGQGDFGGKYLTSQRMSPEAEKEIKKSPEYVAIANGINRTLPAGKQFKRGSDQEFKAVKAYLEKHKNLTTQNSYIAPFTSTTGLLFADKSLTKDVGEASKELLGRIHNTSADVYTDSPDGGKTKVKIDPSTITNFSYSGDMSPESYVNAFPNSKQNIMPHFGTATIGTGKDARTVPVYVSRDPNDFSSSQYKGAKDINTLKNSVRATPGIYKHMNSEAVSGFQRHGMKDVLVKYNAGSQTYDINYKYPTTDSSGKEVEQTFSTNHIAEDKLNQWLISLNE